MAEDCHSDDGVDEGDEGEQGPDVEERRQGDNQGKQQLPDSFGSLKQKTSSGSSSEEKRKFCDYEAGFREAIPVKIGICLDIDNITFKTKTIDNVNLYDLDEAQDPANPEDPDDPEECWGDREVSHEVLHQDAHD